MAEVREDSRRERGDRRLRLEARRSGRPGLAIRAVLPVVRLARGPGLRGERDRARDLPRRDRGIGLGAGGRLAHGEARGLRDGRRVGRVRVGELLRVRVELIEVGNEGRPLRVARLDGALRLGLCGRLGGHERGDVGRDLGQSRHGFGEGRLVVGHRLDDAVGVHDERGDGAGNAGDDDCAGRVRHGQRRIVGVGSGVKAVRSRNVRGEGATSTPDASYGRAERRRRERGRDRLRPGSVSCLVRPPALQVRQAVLQAGHLMAKAGHLLPEGVVLGLQRADGLDFESLNLLHAQRLETVGVVSDPTREDLFYLLGDETMLRTGLLPVLPRIFHSKVTPLRRSSLSIAPSSG